jgi:hypothetical protein
MNATPSSEATSCGDLCLIQPWLRPADMDLLQFIVNLEARLGLWSFKQ